MINPNDFIALLRLSFAGSVQVYTMNSCYRLFLILKALYPSATCYWSPNKRHAITRISGKFYDIKGEVIDTNGYYKMKKMNKSYAEPHFSIYQLIEDVRRDEKCYEMFKKSQLTDGNLTGHEIFTEIMNSSLNGHLYPSPQ